MAATCHRKLLSMWNVAGQSEKFLMLFYFINWNGNSCTWLGAATWDRAVHQLAFLAHGDSQDTNAISPILNISELVRKGSPVVDKIIKIAIDFLKQCNHMTDIIDTKIASLLKVQFCFDGSVIICNCPLNTLNWTCLACSFTVYMQTVFYGTFIFS